jgi:sugar/nucleoside kinase (ribokinase family)
MKQRAEGVTVFDAARDQMVEVPAITGAVLDTTGAGDSFCGAFVAVYSRDPNNSYERRPQAWLPPRSLSPISEWMGCWELSQPKLMSECTAR